MSFDRVSVDAEFYPVESYFNWIGHDRFIEALENFSSGRGDSIQNASCDFPSDISEGEHIPLEKIDYVRFWTYANNQQEVHVSIPQFMAFLREAAAVEARLRPERAERIRELVGATARALNVPHGSET